MNVNGDDVNRLSFELSNRIYEFAARFPHRESYEPLENLARHVQELAVRAGAEALRAHDRRRREPAGRSTA